MMPGKAEHEDRRSQHSSENVLQSSTVYARPWWKEAGNNEKVSKQSFGELRNGSLVNGASGGLDDGNGNGLHKEMPPNVVASRSDGNNGPEHLLKTVPFSTALTVGEHLDPNSEMELVGHSIVLTPYPYVEPHYGGVLSPYGHQQVPAHLYGMFPGRMPLPLEMEEEPVYVNAKQYHGILRRRQSRAKAELEKKAIKVRKPYLHESRHLHAMRRARGCGGRFLNTKKLDNNVMSPTSEKGTNSDSKQSTQSTSDGNVDSSGHQKEGLVQTLSNGNGNSHGLSSTYGLRFNDGKEGDWLGQGRESMQLNGSAHGAISIK
ncbi:hypothetical protein TIFTF001_022738 [Ficus carica]|uniref:Nuclear transcription factor Y subunit n=1 Tax=Ficus carica TaxID=3494 RepID=A0AA88AID9_FICCA|nr:hypothetical protein TIFTF001_022738 [Ficus carica]